MTPSPTRQMRLPLAGTAEPAPEGDTDSDPSSPPLAREESCPRCRGTGTPIRRRDVIARCYACASRALRGASGDASLPRYCEHHVCTFCVGTGAVCAVCHGTRWLRRVVFPVGNEAVRCSACNVSKEASL